MSTTCSKYAKDRPDPLRLDGQVTDHTPVTLPAHHGQNGLEHVEMH
jgi:hypothetical protein